MKVIPIITALFLFSCHSPPRISKSKARAVTEASAFSEEQLLTTLAYLSSDALNGRGTNTEGNKKAREHIIGRLETMEISSFLASTFEQPFSFKNSAGDEIPGINVLAKIEGKTNKIIVLSAHYDHLGFHNGEIYNGADDNASGTTALLAMAEHFSQHKPNHTLVFAWIDAEEKGLQGAKHLADNFQSGIEKVILNINMDMVSRKFNGANDLWAVGTFHYPDLKPIIASIETNLNIRFGHDNPEVKSEQDWTFSSDHAAFHAKDIPFIYFGVDDHKDYHKPTDDYENVDHDFYLDVVAFIIKTVDTFDGKLE